MYVSNLQYMRMVFQSVIDVWCIEAGYLYSRLHGGCSVYENGSSLVQRSAQGEPLVDRKYITNTSPIEFRSPEIVYIRTVRFDLARILKKLFCIGHFKLDWFRLRSDGRIKTQIICYLRRSDSRWIYFFVGFSDG